MRTSKRDADRNYICTILENEDGVEIFEFAHKDNPTLKLFSVVKAAKYQSLEDEWYGQVYWHGDTEECMPEGDIICLLGKTRAEAKTEMAIRYENRELSKREVDEIVRLHFKDFLNYLSYYVDDGGGSCREYFVYGDKRLGVLEQRGSDFWKFHDFFGTSHSLNGDFEDALKQVKKICDDADRERSLGARVRLNQ